MDFSSPGVSNLGLNPLSADDLATLQLMMALADPPQISPFGPFGGLGGFGFPFGFRRFPFFFRRFPFRFPFLFPFLFPFRRRFPFRFPFGFRGDFDEDDFF